MATLSNFLIAGMVGIMGFFTVVIAPMIFKVLPAEAASRYVRAFFPRYYFSLLVLAIIATLTANSIVHQYTLSSVSLLFLINLVWLTPSINLATDQKQSKRFFWLHAASVAINIGQLVACIVLLLNTSI